MPALFTSDAERLLDMYVLAGANRVHTHPVVSLWNGQIHNDLNLGIGQQLAYRQRSRYAVLFCLGLRPMRVQVGACDYIQVSKRLPGLKVYAADVAATYNS